MNKLLFTLLIIVLPCVLRAQYVNYDIEESVQNVQRKHTECWKQIGKINTYCIQVGSFTGENSNVKSQNMKAEISHFLIGCAPSIKVYVFFDAPNHKVRIGNFKSKIEAYQILSIIRDKCPGAFVTTDKRKISDIIE